MKTENASRIHGLVSKIRALQGNRSSVMYLVNRLGLDEIKITHTDSDGITTTIYLSDSNSVPVKEFLRSVQEEWSEEIKELHKELEEI